MVVGSRLRLVLLCCLLLCGIGEWAVAQSQPRETKINRIFVPAGKPETWPPGDWIPIAPERLQALLAQQGRPAPRTLVVNEARLHASFDPNRNALVSGRAVISFADKVPTDRLVGLSPMNVAIRSPKWTRATDRSVVLGYDEHQQLQVAVPPDGGELQFDWQLAGTSRLNGVEFDLRLPRSIVGEVSVDTPKDWSLSVGTTTLKPEAQPDGSLRWTINAMPGNGLRLLLSPDSLKAAPYAATTSLLYRQTTTMQLSRGRLDERTDYALDPLSVIPAQWQLPLPPEWHCDAVSLNGRLLTENEWRVTTANKESLLTVPLAGQSMLAVPTISVRISRTFAAGVKQAIGVCPAPKHERAVLLSGQVELQVASSLALVRHEPHDLRQTEVRLDEGVERLTFQQDRSGAQIELQWSDQAELLRLETRQFVVVNLEDSPASFLADIEIEPQTGSLFDMSIALPRNWELSDVLLTNGTSNGRRIDWTVVPGETDQQLKLSFPDGVSANSAVMIRLNGHYVGTARTTDFAAPIGVLSRGNPDTLLVAVTGSSTAATLVAPNNRFQIATTESVILARAWTPLAKLASDKNSRVWIATGLDSTVDLRESRLRAQAPTTEPAPANASNPVTPALTTTPSKTTESKASRDGFRPVFAGTLRSTLSPGRASRDQHELSLKLLYASEGGLLEFRMPAHAQLQHVEWHGQRIAATNVGDKLSVPLQSPLPGDELGIHYTLPAEMLYLRETYQADLPEFAVPIDGLEWEVRLPSHFMVVSFPGDFVFDGRRSRPHWLAWLFGPLARRRDDDVFNPFDAEQWQPLFIGDEDNVIGETDSDDGWMSYTARTPRLPESLAIEVCDRLRLAATAWLILAATACVGVMLRAAKSNRRNAFGIVWLTLAVASTMLISTAYAELVGATIVGSVIACLIPRGLIRREPKAPTDRTHERHFAPTVTVQQGLLGVLLLAISLRALTAQDAPSAAAPLESIDLLVEYEGDRFAAPLKTGLICVPATTLEQLTKNAAPTATTTRALFQAAKYNGEWTVNGLSKLTSSWDVWVPHSSATTKTATTFDEVVIPLPLRAIADVGQFRMNGRPLELIPNADGQSVRVRIPKIKDNGASSALPPVPEERIIPLADKWRLVMLEAELRPQPLRSFNQVAWHVPVPRTLRSEVEIAQPDPVLERPAFSAGWIGASPERLGVGAFDPVNELKLTQRRADAANLQPVVSVKLKSHIELAAESSRRVLLAHYSVERGELKQVAWKLPPHAIVQTDRIMAPQLRAAQVRRTETETLLLVEFSPPLAGDFQVAVPWLLPERQPEASRTIVWERPVATTAPHAELEVREHLAGVTTAPGFVWRPTNSSPTSLGSEAETEFLNGWPSSQTLRAPQLVWNVAAQPSPQWRLSPAIADKAARWTTLALIDRDSIAWHFTARVEVAGAPAFVHQLEVDPRLTIEAVTVTQDDVNRLAYWTRQGDRLFLHLRDRVSGTQLIRVQALEANRDTDVVSYPRMDLTGAKSGELNLRVQRTRGVSVEVAGAEIPESVDFDIEPEHVTLNAVEVGAYRVRAAADVSMLVRLLPVVSRSWCVATIDSGTTHPAIELAFNIEPGRLERTLLTLPNWPLGDGIVAEIDGDPSASIKVKPGAPQSWAIELGKNTDLPLQVRLHVPLVETDDMFEIELAAPVLEGVEEQTVGWASQQKKMDAATSDVLSEAQRIVFLERGIMAPILIDVPIMDWKRSTLTVPRASVVVERLNELPCLVQHELWLGRRERTAARTTILTVATPGALKVSWPNNIVMQACLVNSVPRSIERDGQGQLIVPLNSSDLMATVELLWSQQESHRPLRIEQRQLSLPTIQAAKILERATLALTDSHQALPIQKQLSKHNNEWPTALESWSTETSLRPALMTKQLTEVMNRFQSDLDPVDESSSNSSRQVVRFENLNNSTLRVWVVDERLDHVAISVLLALLVAPVIRLLMQFRTGDWLASRPAMACAALSGIWWLCLHGSGLGLAALCCSLLAMGLAWIRRQRESELSVLRNASASLSRSRHSF